MSAWRRVQYGSTDQVVWAARSRAGLELRIAPMAHAARCEAVVAARFGSIHDRLPSGERLPPGTAHMLEHQMFQRPEGDLFERLAAMGASANAWTSPIATAYQVGAAREILPPLERLLAALRSFESTPRALARERGIVAEEIAGSADDADWRGWIELMKCLYRRHPVRQDIAGSPRDLADISLGLLGRVHGAAYGSRNLVVAVAGTVDPDAVRDLVDRTFPRVVGAPWRPSQQVEGGWPAKRRATLHLPTQRPFVWVGWKLAPPATRAARTRARVEWDLLAEALFGDGGLVEGPLYEAGLAQEDFGASVDVEPSFAHIAVAGSAEEPALFLAGIERALAAAGARLGAPELERVRRRFLGARARRVGRAEATADALANEALQGASPSEDLRWARMATPSSLRRRLATLRPATRAVAIVEPA